MTRILLDTDVNLDFILARQLFFGEAEEIFVQIAQIKRKLFGEKLKPKNLRICPRLED